MNVLITGSTGYVGKSLVNKLLVGMSGHLITLNSKSFSELKENNRNWKLSNLGEKLRNIKFDYIIHLAVKTEAGDYCKIHQGEQFLINTEITNTILQYWKKHQSQAHFITFGSSCGYNNEVDKIESNYFEGVPEKGYETYGYIKRYLLTGLQALEKEYGMKYTYWIPSTVYGPGYDLEDKHFIFDLIRKIYNGKYGDEVVLWGDGSQRRNIIYIDDLVDILIYNLEGNKEIGIRNLCSLSNYNIKEYANIICNILGYDINKIKWDKSKHVGTLDKSMPHSIPYNYISGYEGLEKTIDYFLLKTKQRELLENVMKEDQKDGLYDEKI